MAKRKKSYDIDKIRNLIIKLVKNESNDQILKIKLNFLIQDVYITGKIDKAIELMK